MAREQLARRRSGRQDYAAPEKSEETSVDESSVLSAPGWGVREVKSEKSGVPTFRFATESKRNIIKFLDESPFTSYLQHWVGKYPKPCLGTGCPLCSVGDRPRPVYLFNIVDMTGEDKPTIKVWYASPDPFNAIRERSETSNTSPINKADLYFNVTKAAADNGVNKFSVTPVKGRDLPDDWEIEALSAGEVDGFAEQRYDRSIVRIASADELRQAASELED